MRHVLPSLAIAAAVTASTLGATAAPAAPPNSTPVYYLAAGDSYPAGWGVTQTQSYPALLDAATYANIELDNNARAGADTFELVFGHSGLPSQLSGDNSVVTITVGANDIDWVKVISGDPTATGLLRSRMGALAGMNGATAPDGYPVLPIAGVLQQVAAVNPDATILVTGYPHLFGDLAPTDLCDVGGRVVSGMQTDQANELTDQLNAIIEASVAAVSVGPGAIKAEYVDVVPTFADHGICDTQTAWLYDLDDLSMVQTPNGAFHPNARGQKAYALEVQKDGFRSAALAIAQGK